MSNLECLQQNFTSKTTRLLLWSNLLHQTWVRDYKKKNTTEITNLCIWINGQHLVDIYHSVLNQMYPLNKSRGVRFLEQHNPNQTRWQKYRKNIRIVNEELNDVKRRTYSSLFVKLQLIHLAFFQHYLRHKTIHD